MQKNACRAIHNLPFNTHTKVYRLGGETDSAIRWRKRTSCDVGERPEEAGLKMPSIFYEFLCYNRKLCVNKLIIFFSYNTGLNVNKTHTTEHFKSSKTFKTSRFDMNLKSLNICLNLNANILPKHSDSHNYSTRNNNEFIAPKLNMKKSKMSINFKSIKIWNKLPVDIRTSDSLNVFMDNLWTHCLSRYTEFITNIFFIFCEMLYLCVMCYQQ